MRSNWANDGAIAAQEAKRKATAQQAKFEYQRRVALQMREDGHTREEIVERTGLPRTTVDNLFRGLGRRR